MRDVSIIGVGITPFGVREESLTALGAIACRNALGDAGLAPEQIEAFFLGNFAGHAFVGQNHIAPMVAHARGWRDTLHPSGGACASGGLAMRQGVLAVASGQVDFALVAGVEKMTAAETDETASILAAAGDVAVEARVGSTFPALFGLIARRHMYEYGTTREEIAHVAVKNHAHGKLNPNAHMQKDVTLPQVLDAKLVAEPLGLFDCSLISDGAAAVVLCPAEIASAHHEKPIAVLASTQASDSPALSDKRDITSFYATQKAGEEAFSQARLSREDVDLAEIHDCFTVAEIIALEDLGFFAKGEGGRGALEGMTKLGGAMPVNTSGGLKSKGHPVGATGVAQIHELTLQLRGEAGARQAPGAEVGLAHNLGGSGATCAVHILGATA